MKFKNALTFTLTGPGNVPVAGAVSTTQLYSSSPSRYFTRADFQPLSGLDVFATYTATIDGSVKDYAGGNAMGLEYTWTSRQGSRSPDILLTVMAATMEASL